MNKLILITMTAIASFVISCHSNNQTVRGRQNVIEDSLKTDSVFKYKIALLTKSIDSLLPYAEQKKIKLQFAQEYQGMVSQNVKERTTELNLQKDVDGTYGAFIKNDVYQTVKYELEQNGYGPKYFDKQYLDWERTHSKNVVSQRFKEEELKQLQSDYSYFKNK